MSRDHLSAGLQALLAGYRWSQHSAFDITLSSGTQLHFSTIEKLVNGVSYLAKLTRDIGELSMGLTIEMDEMEFGVQNVDKVMGQTLTGAVSQLDGAKAVKGQIFFDPDNADVSYYDPQVPGELIAGDVTDEKVAFHFISEIDAVVIGGDLVSEEFIGAVASTPRPELPDDPGILVPQPGGGGFNPVDNGWVGRHPPYTPIDLPDPHQMLPL